MRRWMPALLAGAGWACAAGTAPGAGASWEAAARAVADGVRSGSPLADLLEAAGAGDARAEALVGFMFFYGESAPRDPGAALYWFERSAQRGDAVAQLNMALLYELGIGLRRSRQAALRFFRMARDNPERPPSLEVPSLLGVVQSACAPPRGVGDDDVVFATFCAGCHGRLGLAAHPEAPDFALGERLERSDDELHRTIQRGHGRMPEWSDKLPPAMIQAALRQARRMAEEFRAGALHRVRPIPDLAFKFGLMAEPAWTYALDPFELPPGPSFEEACSARWRPPPTQ